MYSYVSVFIIFYSIFYCPTDKFVFKLLIIKPNGDIAQQSKQKVLLKNVINKRYMTLYYVVMESVNLLTKINSK